MQGSPESLRHLSRPKTLQKENLVEVLQHDSYSNTDSSKQKSVTVIFRGRSALAACLSVLHAFLFLEQHACTEDIGKHEIFQHARAESVAKHVSMPAFCVSGESQSLLRFPSCSKMRTQFARFEPFEPSLAVESQANRVNRIWVLTMFRSAICNLEHHNHVTWTHHSAESITVIHILGLRS